MSHARGHSSLHRFAARLACAVALAHLPVTAPGADLHLDAGLVSDYVVHGRSRTRGQRAVQAGMALSGDRGWSLGLWGSEVDLYEGPGSNAEYALFAAHRRRMAADLALDVQLTRYEFPSDRPVISYDYTELRAALTYRDALELAIAASPDLSLFSLRGPVRERHAIWSELSVFYPLGRSSSLTAMAGYADLHAHLGEGYAYYSLGAEWQGARLVLSFAHVQTDDTARRLFGRSQAGRRWVAGFLWRIH